MSDRPTNSDAGSQLDTSSIVERALESVLDQVPDQPDFDVPDGGGRIQPWADVAATPGKNKRPLEELLAEYAARVAADPDAKAGVPSEKPAAEAFLDRFSKSARPDGTAGAGGSRSKRRRRGRSSSSGTSLGGAEVGDSQGQGQGQRSNPGGQPGQRSGGGRGRGRSGRSRGPGGDPVAPGTPRQGGQVRPGGSGQPRSGGEGAPPPSGDGAAGTARRRRRGRGGRGRGSGGSGGGQTGGGGNAGSGGNAGGTSGASAPA